MSQLLDADPRERESIERDLASADEDVRRLAVERSAALAPDGVLPLLVERLGDASWRVRKAAVERLVAMPDADRVARALVAALGDGENPGRRNSAVEALVRCGGRAVPVLLEATRTEDVDVRKLVVDALAGIADGRSVPALLALLSDADPNVRAAAADALGATGGEGAPEALLALATRADEDQLVRFSALHALGALEVPVLAGDLTAVLDDPLLRPQGLSLLGRRTDDREAVDVLVKGLSAGGRSGREAAMRSLLRLLGRLDLDASERLMARLREACAAAPEVVDAAVERLGEADLATRLVLVQFLGLLGEPRVVVPILECGRDEALREVGLATLEALGEIAEEALDAAWTALDAVGRRDACIVFGRIPGRRGAARLLTALEEPAVELRSEAARAIGRRRLADALPLLVRRLEGVAQDEDFEAEDEMVALTEALIAVAEPRPGAEEVTRQAIELLRGRLEGAGEAVRLSIAKVLGRIGRHDDIDLVSLLLKDPSALVRRAAVDSLARLEPGTAAEPLRLALADEAAAVRIAAAGALGASESDAVVEDLKRLCLDEDPRVRAAAVRAIGRRFGTSEDAALRDEALRAVEAALGDDTLPALSAVDVLGEVGGPAARRAEALLGRPEPEVVKQAVACLARHGEDEALEALLPLVSHGDWSVRAEAIGALAERGVTRGVPPILRRLETEQDEFVRDAILRALRRLEG